MRKLLAMLAALLLLAIPVMAEEADLQDAANGAYARVLLGGEAYLPLTDDAVMPSQWKAVRFTLLDMNGDGISEVVVELAETESFVVLTWDEMSDSVYGSEFPYRGMLDLKDDGSFTFSSGAFDNGVAKLQFEMEDDGDVLTGMGYLTLAECSSTEDGGVVCTLDGGAEQTDEAGYRAFLAEQQAKLDALWYDYSQETVKLLLGQ